MESQWTENRRAKRFCEPGGSALCMTHGRTERYHIQDASRSGVALSGPALELGTPVSLQLWWPMIGKATAQGVVCREDRSSQRIGVKYTGDQGVDNLLGNLGAIDRMRKTEATPLFCGSSEPLSVAMQQLDEAGFAYRHAKTPLEAVGFLQDPWQPLSSTICAPTATWLEFSAFVRTEHSTLRRIVLGGQKPNAELVQAVELGMMDELFCEPWHPNGLYAALGLQLGDDPCVCCGARMPASAIAFCRPCTARSSQLCELDDLGGGD